jgi:hypothetical protein
MLKEQPGMLIRLLIFLLLAACTPQTAEDGADGSPGKRGLLLETFTAAGQVIYLPVQPPNEASMAALIEGRLAEVNGCLRLKEYLLILPPDTYLREDPLRLVDGDLEPIAQIGEAVQLTGAERKAADYRYFDNKVQCAGPYWGVNQITAAE